MSSAPKLFRKDEVEGKIVVETSGRSIGKATEIAFSLEGMTALIVKGYDGAEIQITMDKVTGVGDFIVVRADKGDAIPANRPVANTPTSPVIVTPTSPARVQIPVTSASSSPTSSSTPASSMTSSTVSITSPTASSSVSATPAATMVCKTCGASLRAGARFCTKCGAAV